jgi:hypothetical protein
MGIFFHLILLISFHYPNRNGISLYSQDRRKGKTAKSCLAWILQSGTWYWHCQHNGNSGSGMVFLPA